MTELEERGYLEIERSSADAYHVKYTWIGHDKPTLGVPLHKSSAVGTAPVDTDAPVVAVDDGAALSPKAMMRPPTGDPVITREQVERVLDELISAAENRVSRDELDQKTTALTVIHRMCKDVENGKMSALRAIVEIEETARMFQ